MKNEKDCLIEHLEQFISEIKENNPEKVDTANFKSAIALVRKFCLAYPDIDTKDLSLKDCHAWFNTLDYYQQKKAKYQLGKFIDFLYIQDALSIQTNPFKTGAIGEVAVKPKPMKSRRRMDKEDFQAIVTKADEAGVQWFVNAMYLAILLRLRRQDIVQLRFDNINVKEGYMYCRILKSENQKGADQGHILLFNLKDPAYQEAYQIIENAKLTRDIEIHGGVTERSPYVIHNRPQLISAQIPKGKTHYSQVTEHTLSRTFQLFRDLCPEIQQKAEDEGLSPTTFHEIRSLGARMDREKGLSVDDISRSLAHSGLDVTKDKYLSENISRIEVAKTLVTLKDFEKGE